MVLNPFALSLTYILTDSANSAKSCPATFNMIQSKFAFAAAALCLPPEWEAIGSLGCTMV